MKFLVEASGNSDRVARAEGEVVFHIFSEAYWDPLVVVSNNSLLVEESTSIAITAYDLQVGRREGGGTSSLGQPLPLMNAFSPPLFVHLGGGRLCLLGEKEVGRASKKFSGSVRWSLTCVSLRRIVTANSRKATGK